MTATYAVGDRPHSPSSLHEHSSACASGHNKPDALMMNLKKASDVALGLFSAYTDAKLFIPFFLVGTGLGVYNSIYDMKWCNYSIGSSCGSDLNLPPQLLLIATFVIALTHIDHHSTVFVPIMATSFGVTFGTEIANLFKPSRHPHGNVA